MHCYNILEEYCYYEIQIQKALCEFAVEKGYCWLKEGLPLRHIYKEIICFCFETIILVRNGNIRYMYKFFAKKNSRCPPTMKHC